MENKISPFLRKGEVAVGAVLVVAYGIIAPGALVGICSGKWECIGHLIEPDWWKMVGLVGIGVGLMVDGIRGGR